MNKNIKINICFLLPIFRDIALALHHSFNELGFSTQISRNSMNNDAINVIYGSHLIKDLTGLPANSILINLEQLASGSHFVTESYLNNLRRFKVWDYSQRNIDFLRKNEINCPASLLPLAYSPCLSRIKSAQIQDIDVLFYGVINARRERVLCDLRETGMKVEILAGVYGADLDEYISRSKVVLNLHYYETKMFESVRVGFLLNNRKAVVAEVDEDTEIDPVFRAAIVGAQYENLVERAEQLVRDTEFRMQVEERGYQIYSARPQTQLLESVLSELICT